MRSSRSLRRRRSFGKSALFGHFGWTLRGTPAASGNSREVHRNPSANPKVPSFPRISSSNRNMRIAILPPLNNYPREGEIRMHSESGRQLLK